MEAQGSFQSAPPQGEALEIDWVLIKPIDNRLSAMEKRLIRMEKSINTLLSLFNIPIPDNEDEASTEEQPAAPVIDIPAPAHIEIPGEDADVVEDGMFSLFDMAEGGEEVTPIFHTEDLQVVQSIPATTSAPAPTPKRTTAPVIKDGKYTYKPLDKSKSQARVLVLNRSTAFDDPIIADLKAVSLDDSSLAYSADAYTALSYTWGAPVFDGSIILNGYAFPVTKNLEQALRYMRDKQPKYPSWPDKDGSTNWWIDQICINQEDIDERSQQVDLMRRIYKRASDVSVWLGEEADDSTVAINLFKSLNVWPANAPGEKAFEYPSFSDEEVHRHWKALDALFKRPWWERVWIRQEVALSRDVKLFCGNASCSMDLLGPALSALRYAQYLGLKAPVSHVLHGSGSDEGTLAVPWDFHPHSLARLRENTSGGDMWVSLEDMLPVAKSCKATDPRDTVFSLLGLCDPETYRVHVNYRNTLAAVLTAATKAIMGNEYDLDILGTCQNPGRKHNLPSWVPNLNEPWKAMPFPVNDKENRRKLILRVTDYDSTKAKVEGQCLAVKGGLIDTIALICNDVVQNNASDDDLDALYEAWQRFVILAGKSKALHQTEKYDFMRQDDDQWAVASSPEERTRNWIRFLTILDDEGDGAGPTKRRKKRSKKKNRDFDDGDGDKSEILMAAEEELGSIIGPNLRLCRLYLVPPSHNYRLHPNRRIHAGLRANGPGRRLVVSKGGYIALAPAEVEIGDAVAIFQGATFPYVLRAHGEKQGHVLVGECFVPTFVAANGESLARDEFRKGLNKMIRLF